MTSNGMLVSTPGPTLSIEQILLMATSLTTSSISPLFIFFFCSFATNLYVPTLFSKMMPRAPLPMIEPFNYGLNGRLSTLTYTQNSQIRTRYSAIIPLLLILIRYTAIGATLLSGTLTMRWRRILSDDNSFNTLSVVTPFMN
jgi:hypothetical protein